MPATVLIQKEMWLHFSTVLEHGKLSNKDISQKLKPHTQDKIEGFDSVKMSNSWMVKIP